MQPEDVQEGLTSIQEKLKRLLDKYSTLQKENQKLSADKENLLKQVAAKDEQLKIMKQQNDVLKSGIQKWHPEQKKLFVKRIDSYLREIEKCIALINE